MAAGRRTRAFAAVTHRAVTHRHPPEDQNVPPAANVEATSTRRAEARAAHAARVAAWADASGDSLDDDAVDDSDVEEVYAPLAERLEARRRLGRNEDSRGAPGNVIKISVSP